MALNNPPTAAIEALASEVTWLEQSAPLEAMSEVSLGDSFAQRLPRHWQGFARQETTGAVRSYRLRDAMLDGPTMALFHGGQAIAETLYMVSPEECDDALARPLPAAPTDPEQHTILGVNRAFRNYYHWMVQSLPAIDWGLRNRGDHQVAVALPPLQPWQEMTLELLGHAGTPRLTLDPKGAFAVGPRALYQMANVEYSEFLGERLPLIVSRSAAITYGRLREAVAPEPGVEIYVARTDAQNRVAVNEAALIAMLQQQGVRIVVPGALPVAQQLAIFRGARLVIGAHGAGLANIVACEPGSHLYELVPYHYPNVCFNRLAQACRLHYWADVFPSEPEPLGPHQRRWRIDLDVVAARLEEVRARMAATRPAVGSAERGGRLRRFADALGWFRR